jgi:hypothetical protein
MGGTWERGGGINCYCYCYCDMVQDLQGTQYRCAGEGLEGLTRCASCVRGWVSLRQQRCGLRRGRGGSGLTSTALPTCG